MATIESLDESRLTRRDLRRFDVPVLTLTALAIAIASVHLTTKSLDADEIVSATYAQMPIGRLWQVITGPDPNMGLYYLLLHVWASLFGAGAGALRIFGVLLSSTSVGLLIRVGTRLFNRRAGLVAGLLLAVDTAFVASEQDIRSYGLLVAIGLLSTLLFLRAVDDPTPRRLSWYVAVSVTALYIHYFAGLLLLVHLVALVARRGQREYATRWALAGCAIGVAFVPEGIFASGDRANVSWIQRPSVHDLLGFPGYLTGGYAHGGVWAAAVMIVVIAGWLALRRRETMHWPVFLCLTWLLLPVVLNFGESRVGQSFWVDQYMIIVLPAFLLLFGAGLAALPRRELFVGGLVLVIALLGIDLKRFYDGPPVDNYRAANYYLLTHEHAGDVALYGPGDRVVIGAASGRVDWGTAYYAAMIGEKPPPPVTLSDLAQVGTAKPPRVWFEMRGSPATVAPVVRAVAHQLGQWYREAPGLPEVAEGPTVALFVRRST